MGVEIWVDLETAAGVHVGGGPITTVRSWTQEEVLDGAGRFSFDMSLNDPQTPYVRELLVARCFESSPGGPRELGSGVIQGIDIVISGQGEPRLIVRGSDLLGELAGRTVLFERVLEEGWTFLSEGRGSVRLLTSSSESDLPEAYDGDYGTFTDEITITDYRWIYVGHDARYDQIRWLLYDTNDTRTTTIQYQYYSSTSGWRDIPDMSDGTIVGGRPMAQTGNYVFSRPADWARSTPTLDSGSRFWTRFRRTPDVGNDFSFRITEVTVYGDIPTRNGPTILMDHAPAGWTITPGTTDNEAYLEFSGESVLGALQVLAARVGEHFRLGEGRQVVWLGEDEELADVRAVAAGHSPAQEDVEGLLHVSGITETRDAYEMATRVIPYGAGQGDGRISLLLTERTPPAGYTLSRTGNTLTSDAGVSDYGVIEHVGQFDNIVSMQADSWLVQPTLAANALFDAALAWLKERDAPAVHYELDVVGSTPAFALRVGQALHVVYQRWVDGIRVLSIDTYEDDSPLHVLGVTREVRPDGSRTVALQVATVRRLPDSDVGVVVDTIQRMRRMQAMNPEGSGTWVGGGISGGGSSEPGTLSALTPNQDAGGIHTHAIDASSDPGEAEALLKTNEDGELTLEWLYVTWDVFVTEGDVEVWDGDLYVAGDVDFGSGSEYLKLDGAYFGAYTTQYCYTWLQSIDSDFDATHEVWDFGASAPWADVLDGFGGYFTFRARTVYGGSSGAFPALARWHWWAADVTQETYKGAAGIALLHGDGGNGDGNEEMVLSLVAGGDHTLKLQDNAGATKIGFLDSDDVEVASIDSDGLLSTLGMVSGGHLLPSVSEAYDLGSPSRLWRSGYLSELRAVLFAEETIQLVGGWLIVPKDAGAFEGDVGSTDMTIDFGKSMTPGHWVLVRSYDAGTGMPAAEYFTVGSLVSGTTYNVTRDVDGSGANDWAAGTPFLVLGEEGDGRIELNAYDTPRIQIVQQGADYNLVNEVVRIGDLDGAFGITEERYGFGVGDYAEGNYLRYDPTNGFIVKGGGGNLSIDENGLTLTPSSAFSYGAGSGIQWETGGENIAQMFAWNEAPAGGVGAIIRAYGADVGSASVLLRAQHSGVGEESNYGSLAVTHGLSGGSGKVTIGPELAVDGSITESVAVGCRVYRSTSQSLGDGSWTNLSWDTEIEDTDDCWDSANPTRLVAQRAGVYIVSFSVTWNVGGTGGGLRCHSRVQKNGSVTEKQISTSTLSGSYYLGQGMTAVVVMDEDDYLECGIWHTTGAARDTNAATASALQEHSVAFYRIA